MKEQQEKSFDSKIPRILYHGTTDKYLLDCFIKFDHYSPWSTKTELYVSGHICEAVGFSFKRSKQYNCLPLTLVIDTHKLNYPVIMTQSRTVSRFNWDSFLIYDPKLYGHSKNYPMTYMKDISEIEQTILTISKKEILKDSSSVFIWHSDKIL